MSESNETKKNEVLEVEVVGNEVETSIVKPKKTRKRLTKEQWKQIQTEWTFQDVSFRELAERHGIGKNTIEKRSSEENWAIYKKSKKIERNEAILNYCMNTVRDYSEMRDLIMDDVRKKWKINDTTFTDKKQMVEIYKMCDTEITRNLYITDSE